MPFSDHPNREAGKSLAQAVYQPFWLDDPNRPQANQPMSGKHSCDLLIVGAGFLGLWTAWLAREANPGREVILLEGKETATGASGLNGGFVEASLTHGFANGLSRWPEELAALTAMGHANLKAIQNTVERLAIDCDYLPAGTLNVALEPYQVQLLQKEIKLSASYGESEHWLDGDQVRRRVNSPVYLGAKYNPACAMVNPARLAWGLRRACLEEGVKLFEHTPVEHLDYDGKTVTAHTPHGSVRAAQVALATNAFPPLLKRIAQYMVPVYDYVLVTEPLSSEQRTAIGWQGREGLADIGNQFHYYRTTADGRILWGGYDANYYWNNGFGSRFERNDATFSRLAAHFFQTFPQLEGLCFTHAWGGAIDTCSRFTAFWGRAHGGHTVYSMGYTGLGVGATRFGAQVLLDRLDNRDSARTALKMVHTHPLPFPPEPLRSLIINLTRHSLDRADQEQGRRNLWLRTLDRFGLGFNS
ncbi:MAG: FAD-binding oxidoreductase [Anaerolineales bacterium]|jgi:glycine/D-amino acid oxidase-like deaminating enzyme|nr:FAD-binding oxidoreductase [Anaerolineales bacterium]